MPQQRLRLLGYRRGSPHANAFSRRDRAEVEKEEVENRWAASRCGRRARVRVDGGAGAALPRDDGRELPDKAEGEVGRRGPVSGRLRGLGRSFPVRVEPWTRGAGALGLGSGRRPAEGPGRSLQGRGEPARDGGRGRAVGMRGGRAVGIWLSKER